MLHDIGKLLLAANMTDTFKEALVMARKEQIHLWDAESKVFGATHGELGACLLGIWGLPMPIVEAVALHHYPIRFLSKQFCPLTAVHVANSIEHEIQPDTQGLICATPDANYLTELGLEEQVEGWRDLCKEKLL
jgi:HD-like signal output (HDOD) protein